MTTEIRNASTEEIEDRKAAIQSQINQFQMFAESSRQQAELYEPGGARWACEHAAAIHELKAAQLKVELVRLDCPTSRAV